MIIKNKRVRNTGQEANDGIYTNITLLPVVCRYKYTNIFVPTYLWTKKYVANIFFDVTTVCDSMVTGHLKTGEKFWIRK